MPIGGLLYRQLGGATSLRPDLRFGLTTLARGGHGRIILRRLSAVV